MINKNNLKKLKELISTTIRKNSDKLSSILKKQQELELILAFNKEKVELDKLEKFYKELKLDFSFETFSFAYNFIEELKKDEIFDENIDQPQVSAAQKCIKRTNAAIAKLKKIKKKRFMIYPKVWKYIKMKI